MTEFLDQKQAKQEGKKNLIYSYLNITNNFIVKGSTFIEFHLNSGSEDDKGPKIPNQQYHQIKITTNDSQKVYSLLTYLILWSDDTLQIYQVLGTFQSEGKLVDTSLQCSQQINGRINSVIPFRRENNVYLMVFLEKKKMLTLLYDRQLNCLQCMTQFCFKSQLNNEMNATCLDRELDDDCVRHYNFQGKTDMNISDQNVNEVVSVLISRRILALCFNIGYYDTYYKSVTQQMFNNNLQSHHIYPNIPSSFSSSTHPEMKQNKNIFAPQIFYLDLQKKYDANHVIDYAIVSLNKLKSNPDQILQQQQQQQIIQQHGGYNFQPKPIQMNIYQKIPHIFFINKKIILEKQVQSSIMPNLLPNNLETPVYETELIIVQADLQKYAMQQIQAQQNNGEQNPVQDPLSQMGLGDGQLPQQNAQEPIFNDKFDHEKHPQFKRLPSNTYLIQALENNLILIMSNFYLYIGTPTTEYFEFTCLAFNHQKYNMEQSILFKDFIGQVIKNDLNIDNEDGLENVQFQQLDQNRVLMRALKKIYMLEITLNQFDQLENVQITFVHNFTMQGQSFSARNCIDSGRNEYDLMFLNSRYSYNPQSSCLFMVSTTDDLVEKKLKQDDSNQVSSNTLQQPIQKYKLIICDTFDNWATIKDVSFCDKERPQFNNYYFMTGDMNGRNMIHKCERMIKPKRQEMDVLFKSEDYTERIFEFDESYFIISSRSGKTSIFEKQGAKIIVFHLSNLFLTNISTVHITKGILQEESEQLPIFIQMGANQVRVIDIKNQTFQDLEIDVPTSQFGIGSLGYDTQTSQQQRYDFIN